MESDAGAEGQAQSDMLQRKFCGSLLGALIGDCIGKKFEFDCILPVALNLSKVDTYFKSFRSPASDTPPKMPGSLCYTDDSAMMKVLAGSIIEKHQVDVTDLAKKFTEEYFSDEDRGYGLHVTHVFVQLTKQPKDVLSPAKSQFNGTGSYGNGAAMRVAPVALFYHQDTQKMVEAARQSSLVTHSHADGYNGAILLCLAIQAALKTSPQQSIELITFVNHLEAAMKPIENPRPAYGQILKKMKDLLSRPEHPSIKEVVAELGNDVTALKSVPTAIYAFLRGQVPIQEIEAPNQYERTIQYAISLGGDTDTIGCMAGAISGAQLGVDALPKYLIEPCEANEKVEDLANKLAKLVQEGKA